MCSIKEASFQIRPGDKIGLVGPNGAGKTTIFRIITREEGIDSGDVNIEGRLVVGYFSQDVGEMRGRSALEEVNAGAGKVSKLAHEIAMIEKKLQDSAENPMSDDEMAAGVGSIRRNPARVSSNAAVMTSTPARKRF